MAESCASEMCWNGMSRYLQILGSDAMASITSSGECRGVGVVEAYPPDAVDAAQAAQQFGQAALPVEVEPRSRSCPAQ